MAHTVMLDPLDGREKLVLSNYAAGQTGNLIFIDTVTGEGESIMLPGDGGAWGLVNWRNEKLVVGTCPQHAYLHVLDLKTRTWAEPLQDPGEKYFWKMTLGSDGNVYGGTWPGCSLLRYDPIHHKLQNMGRASDNPKNQYSRPVDGSLPGYILLAGGYDEPFLKAFHIESGTFRDFGTPGFVVREVTDSFICTAKEGELEFYDPRTFERLPDDGLKEKLTVNAVTLPGGKRANAVPLANGRFAGVRGQDVFLVGSLAETPELFRIPVEAPATRIHTIACDEEGRIWGSCEFGQTIFRLDPESGSEWNSSSVCDAGGEVYGIVFVDGKLFMSAYVGGDHVVYDPALPWDQLNNVNPRTLMSVSPDFVRPEGRSVRGPGGGVWTGWSARYGTYGGALSRIDPLTLQVESWRDPIPNEQQVSGLTADDRYLYFATNGGASGLPYKDVRCHFGVWEPGTGLVFEHEFEPGEGTGNAIAAARSKVYVRAGTCIRIFDPQTKTFAGDLATGTACSWLVVVDSRTLAAFCGNKLLLIDTVSDTVLQELELPGKVGAAADATPTGDLIFAVGEAVYMLPSVYIAGIRS
ncbi:hypothetical protein [Paenibacillus ginsengarvi]|uniref:WD40 repeat domain-containing protein n=1 Tax=Paenibacillus ginsengarvi TaxID=400777 RepID=A0A3B0BLB0_9BACL|nr:hypothetical protein [Paenibacillus ginsengarvi]RKN72396.1 hypothetical protein D7M11_28370 [Paenibacillus ginsengarvi]